MDEKASRIGSLISRACNHFATFPEAPDESALEVVYEARLDRESALEIIRAARMLWNKFGASNDPGTSRRDGRVDL